MKTIEYTYTDKNNIHVIQAKVSANSKIGVGYIVQTYHLSLDQVKNNDITLDKSNCLNCPLSYNMNEGKSLCYTAKGMQLFGLKSMLKRLNKNLSTFKPYNKDVFDAFVTTVKNYYPVDLVRFGAYGEPVLLGEYNTAQLATISAKHTGYSHQWKLKKFAWAKYFFMSSTHGQNEANKAKKMGFRNFVVLEKGDVTTGVNCPASKESDKELSCIACGLCIGSNKGIKKDVFINKH